MTKLNGSAEHLKSAQAYFFKINKTLKELVNTVSAKNERQFPLHLLTLKVHFEYFKNEFKQFTLSITPPPRQILYIADLLHGDVIGRYNTLIETIKTQINLLESTAEKITEQFRQGFDAVPLTRSNATYSSEQLQQAIQSCMDSPESASKTMHAIVRNNTELANTCTDIIRLFTSFQRIHQTLPIQALENSPGWFPLLTEAEQIEVGQRIFLHAMYVNPFPNSG